MYFTESGGDADSTSASTTVPADEEQTAVSDGTQVYFNNTELIPKECLLKLTSNEDPKKKLRPLFVVHPIEGFVTAFEPIAKQLNSPIYGLQCTLETPLTSISDMAIYYIKQIKRVQAKGPYLIAGYSFGATIAFEMVLNLEEGGESASLVLVDGAPKYVNFYIDGTRQRQKGHYTQVQDESWGLSYFGFAYANLSYATTIKELESLANFDERLKRLSNLVYAVNKTHPAETVSIL